MADEMGGIGVISGVGKGIIASSTGLLLKSIGLTVTSIKMYRMPWAEIADAR